VYFVINSTFRTHTEADVLGLKVLFRLLEFSLRHLKQLVFVVTGLD
jgi:hypothetical protein